MFGEWCGILPTVDGVPVRWLPRAWRACSLRRSFVQIAGDLPGNHVHKPPHEDLDSSLAVLRVAKENQDAQGDRPFHCLLQKSRTAELRRGLGYGSRLASAFATNSWSPPLRRTEWAVHLWSMARGCPPCLQKPKSLHGADFVGPESGRGPPLSPDAHGRKTTGYVGRRHRLRPVRWHWGATNGTT